MLGLEYHEHTDTILLGSVIGTGKYEGLDLTVIGSGNIVRFELQGIDGYVDLHLGEYAAAAALWLLEKPRASELEEIPGKP